MLKLREPLGEIMQWPSSKVQSLYARFQQNSQSWDTDYSRLLIFVCGNLDEMYHETAQRVQDCDTDADIFHRLTRKLSLIDVKKALGERFKPEQIARLGNAHVIYPSFTLLQAQYQRAYQLLGQHSAALVALVEGLMAQGMVSPQDMAQLLARHGISATHQGSAVNAEDSLILEPFARHWQVFRDAA